MEASEASEYKEEVEKDEEKRDRERQGETLERKSKRRKERETAKEQKERSDLLKRNAWELNHVARGLVREISHCESTRAFAYTHTHTHRGQECYVHSTWPTICVKTKESTYLQIVNLTIFSNFVFIKYSD